MASFNEVQLDFCFVANSLSGAGTDHHNRGMVIVVRNPDQGCALKFWGAPMDTKALQQCVTAAAVSYTAFSLLGAIHRRGVRGLMQDAMSVVLTAARLLPGAAETIDSQIDGALAGLRDKLVPVSPAALHQLPIRGRSASAVAADLRQSIDADFETSGVSRASAFGGLYHHLHTPAAHALHQLQADVAASFLDTNALYPGLFPTVRRLEAEVVSFAVNLLWGKGLRVIPEAEAAAAEPDAIGTDDTNGSTSAPLGLLTSGGTESILLAVKAARDAALTKLGYMSAYGAAEGGGVPPVLAAAADGLVFTIIAGTTAHPALDKACELFGVRLRKLPVDAATQALSPESVARALDRTVLLVYTSAPGFAHGVCDPIVAIAGVAQTYKDAAAWGQAGVPVHVDNCLGGVLLSFQRRAQERAPKQDSCVASSARVPIPAFDFRAAPNIATISIDLHKFGGSPKGVSVLAFRSASMRRCAYFHTSTYPGGLYATPSLSGSRGGAPAALAWATMVHTGGEGYATAAARVAALHAKLVVAISSTPGLVIVGSPHACVIAFTAARNAFAVDCLAARMAAMPSQWGLPLLQSPAALQLCVTERLLEPHRGGATSNTCTTAEGGASAAAVLSALGHNDTRPSAAAAAPAASSVADAWIADLRECTAACLANPRDPEFAGKGDAGIYGAAQILPGAEVANILNKYCDLLTLVR